MPTPYDIKDGLGVDQTFNAYGADNNTLLTSILAKLNASLSVTGTFFQTTQPVSGTVTANAGTGTFAISAASLPLPSGAATETTLAKLTLAQGATTSGQTGALIQGSVTTSAPSYTTGQVAPLSLDPSGQLRITGTVTSGGLNQGSTTSGQQGSLQMGAVTTAAPSYTTGQTNALSLTTGGLLRVDNSGVTQPISGSLTNISGTISLPTGASTSANQTTLNTAFGSSSDGAAANGASGSSMAYLRAIKDAATDTTTVSPVKIDQTTDGTTNLVRASPATTAHAIIPAPSTYRLLSAAASTNGANIKASAGTVKGIQGFNAKASAVYLKLYNKASSPTVGTDTPVKTIYLPATAAFAFDFGTGVSFATGISIALTGAGADADTTALASGDILALNVDYH
jgi:hypothetical protein